MGRTGSGCANRRFKPWSVVGGTVFSHRMALSGTINGVRPESETALRQASALVKKTMQAPSPRKSWATHWWRRHLLWQDWLPNEVKIQYRGPFWKTVYRSFYVPEAL